MIEWYSLPEVQEFIRQYHNQPVADLALSFRGKTSFALAPVLEHIAARQKAKHKLPTWYRDNALFASTRAVEQATAESLALRKSILMGNQSVWVDLTGGLGVDSWARSKMCERVHYVEQDPGLAAAATFNFSQRLNRFNIEVHARLAVDFIKAGDVSSDAVYLDPDRRQEGQRSINLYEHSPDVTRLIPEFRDQFRAWWIKTSPMLDLSAGRRQLAFATDVYILGLAGEVKELLWKVIPGSLDPLLIHMLEIDSNGNDIYFFSHHSDDQLPEPSFASPEAGANLYVPSPVIQKAGLFSWVSQRFSLHKIAPSTHLYLSDHHLPEFPGRIFRIERVISAKQKDIRQHLTDGTYHVSRFNYPMEVSQIRKKYQFREGGEHHLFFITDAQKKRLVLVAKSRQ